MSKMNILVHLRAFRDDSSTNNPSLRNFDWSRDLQALSISDPKSDEMELAPGQSVSLFSGTVATSDDATTTWDLSSPSTNTYRITHSGGTAPLFRTPRSIGHDATTTVATTKNGKVLKYSATGGTLWDLSSVQVGDEVRIGVGFNTANQGVYKILSKTSTEFTVENELGAIESVVLGASFADEVNIYSESGVQLGDKAEIKEGFSSVLFGTYDITDVSHNYIEFFSSESMPLETGVSNSPAAIAVYTDAVQFLYVESDQKIEVTINNTETTEVSPMSAGVSKKIGMYMSTASIKEAQITNKSQSAANVFYARAK